MTACLLWIEKVPDMTGAPSGSSARVVKLTRPCRTCTSCFLPLPLLFWLEFCPGEDFLGCGQLLTPLRAPIYVPQAHGSCSFSLRVFPQGLSIHRTSVLLCLTKH